MAGLPRKYAKMGFKRGWKAFRASKGASKKKVRSSSTKKAKPMARRRSIKSRARRFIGRRKGVVPLADGLTGLYALDGMSNKRVSAAAVNVVGAVVGTPSMSFKNAGDHLTAGFNYAVSNPKDALMEGSKNLAIAILIRKGLGMLGVPRTVNLLGKKIQVR